MNNQPTIADEIPMLTDCDESKTRPSTEQINKAIYNSLKPLLRPSLEIVSDERSGLPSASSFHRTVGCPGWNNLWRQIVEQVYDGKLPPETKSPEAERGIRIHLARETGNTLVLQDESEVKAYERGLELEAQAMQQWLDELNPEQVVEGEREKRIWMRGDNGEKQLSARLDLHFIGKLKTGFQIFAPDLKTGAAKGSGEAATNWQGKVTAVLLFRELPAVESVTFSLIKPEAFPNGYHDSFTYNLAALFESEREVRHHVAESQKPDAPRHAGDHCNYCPCKAWCPEAAAYSMLPSVVARTVSLESKAEIKSRVAMLQPSDWAFIHQRSSVIKNILEAASSNLRQLPEDQLRPLGLRLGSGRTTSDIPGDKVAEACGKLAGLGLPESELWKCLSINKAAAVALIMREYNMKKDAAEVFFESNLAELITSNTGEPILRGL